MKPFVPVVLGLLAASLFSEAGPKKRLPALAQDRKAIECDWQRQEKVKRKKKTVEITYILTFSGGRVYTESHRRIINPRGKVVPPSGGEGDQTDILGSYELKQMKGKRAIVIRPMAYSWDKVEPSTRGQKTRRVAYVLSSDTLTVKAGGPRLKGKWKKKGK
jgi:hypothetical protein